MSGRAALNTQIDNIVKTNGNQEITGALLNQVIKLLVTHQMNLSDDTASFRNFAYNSSGTVNYLPNYLAVQGGVLYVCIAPTSGAFNPAHWITAQQASVVFSYPEWTSGASFSFDEGTREGFKIYRSIIPGVDTNTGNRPSTSPSAWQEISPSEGGDTSTPEWAPGAYKANQQVLKYIDGRLYKFRAVDPLSSSDFDSEFAGGKWEIVGVIVDDANVSANNLWSADKIATELTALSNTLIAALGNKAARVQIEVLFTTLEYPENKTYVLGVKFPFAATITETVTKCGSGTCTATVRINGTPVGGAAHAVSTTEQAISRTSANAISAGQQLEVVITSNSGCVDMNLTVVMNRTLVA